MRGTTLSVGFMPLVDATPLIVAQEMGFTGQPNAMGRREVGGLANMLACHMEIDKPLNRQAVRAFWQSPQMPTQAGLTAADMFQAVAGQPIKAL